MTGPSAKTPPSAPSRSFAPKELVVNVKLLPLLKKRVEIKRLVLNEPNITIIKADARRFNFTSIIETAAPPDTLGTKKPKNSSVAAVLAFADIMDGVVRYVESRGQNRSHHP
jgi:uncharacterized protein involved in outer membrane biogenesis